MALSGCQPTRSWRRLVRRKFFFFEAKKQKTFMSLQIEPSINMRAFKFANVAVENPSLVVAAERIYERWRCKPSWNEYDR